MPDDSPPRGTGAPPRVSVVVPVFNGADVIGDCIRSLLGVAYPRDWAEIIVVDNGSTDGTVGVVESFGGGAVRLLHEAARGASAARNRGIREARGEIVALTDADCVVDPGWLGALVAPLGDPTVGVVGGAVLSRRPCSRIEAFGEVIHDQRSAIEVVSRPYVATGNWGSRRAVLVEAGLFDLTLRRGQDAELSQRIHAAGLRLVYVPEARVYHRNERTLAGLLREGYQHGRAGVLVRDLATAAGRQAPRTTVRARHRKNLGQLRCFPARAHSWLQLLFDLGKTGGELAGLLHQPKAARRPRKGRTPAEPA